MANDDDELKRRRSLLKNLGPVLSGSVNDPRTGLLGRTHERTQGCWNCVHFSHDKAKEIWKERRQADLQAALTIALDSPRGEDDQRVVNMRHMVDAVDTGIATFNLGTCTGGGVDANENPVGTFVKNNYLCHKWTGATGASVARAGQKADKLPMELLDDDETRKPS